MASLNGNDGFSKIVCLLLALPCLVLSPPSRAEIPCAEPLPTVTYDGCLLPDDPSQVYPWTIDPGSHGEPVIDNCQLVIPVEDSLGYFGYRRYDEAFETAESYSMEARVRAEDFYMQGTFVNVSFGISDGQKIASISLTHNPNTGEMRVLACDQSPTCTSIAIDWSIYHDYRVDVWKLGTARFFVDDEMFYEVDYDQLSNSNISPNLSVFGGAESISYWDIVRYKTCIPSHFEDNLIPLEEQITNISSNIGSLDVPGGLKNSLESQLEYVLDAEYPSDQDKLLSHISHLLFQMKFSGIVRSDTTILEALINFARNTIFPKAIANSYRRRLSLSSINVTEGLLIPGFNDYSSQINVNISPTGRQISNHGNHKFGLLLRVGIVDTENGEVVRTISELYELPDNLHAGNVYQMPITFTFNGLRDNGLPIDCGKWYLAAASIDYIMYMGYDGFEIKAFIDEMFWDYSFIHSWDETHPGNGGDGCNEVCETAHTFEFSPVEVLCDDPVHPHETIICIFSYTIEREVVTCIRCGSSYTKSVRLIEKHFEGSICENGEAAPPGCKPFMW